MALKDFSVALTIAPVLVFRSTNGEASAPQIVKIYNNDAINSICIGGDAQMGNLGYHIVPLGSTDVEMATGDELWLRAVTLTATAGMTVNRVDVWPTI